MSKKDLMDKSKPVKFPYASLEAATKDGFKRIGGPDKAFAFMAKGFKATAWRKRHDASAKEAAASAK